jgi:hypothetical protein
MRFVYKPNDKAPITRKRIDSNFDLFYLWMMKITNAQKAIFVVFDI